MRSIRHTLKGIFSAIASNIRSWVAPKSKIMSLHFHEEKLFPVFYKHPSNRIAFHSRVRREFQTVARRIGANRYTITDELVSIHSKKMMRDEKQITVVKTPAKSIFSFREAIQALKQRETTYQEKGFTVSDHQPSSSLHFSIHKFSH